MTTKKGGKPSAAQLAQRAERERKLAAYEAQEAKRATRIQVDQTPVLIAWMVGIGIAFLAAATISFDGITSEASKIGLSADWMQYLMFFVIEFLYLMFLIAYLLLDSRAEPSVGAQVGMWFFASIGVYANGIDSLNHNKWAFDHVDTYTGFILAISAPLAIIVIGKLASRILFAKAVRPV